MKANLFLRTAVVLAAVLAMTGLALGQAQSGNLYGKVVAEDGSVLPGVAVTLSGVGPSLDFKTDSRGEFHYLQLAPSDSYNLNCELAGFGTVDQKGIVVTLGKNTELRIVMKVSKVEAKVTVTGESPIIDTRKITTGASIKRAEMDAMPTARDPWVVVQTVPGVQVDRINVGGNQSGQQSIFNAKGSQTTQGSWNLDGVTISDVGSGASSPTYYDFDSFQEVQIVTGGGDITVQTNGVQMNMVTKRGTNDVRGSARVFITDSKFQSTGTIKPEMQRQINAGLTTAFGNKITGIQDYGIEVGGPVLKDKLWLWGAYGRNQVDLVVVTGQPDKTTLEDVNAKMNVQPIESNGLTVFYLRGDKRKFGRNASALRPPETTVDQSGPSSLYKIEDNQVVSSSLVVDAFYSFFDEGFQLVAEGGTAKQVYQDAGQVWHNSFLSQYFGRPQRQLSGTINQFLSTGPVGHEFKFGGGFRRAETRSKGIWPDQGTAGGLIAFARGSGACAVDCGAITRQSNVKTKNNYLNFYFSDTITMDRLTATLGVRYDNSAGSVMSSSVPATALPAYQSLLPAASAPARDDVVHWKDWSPRVGLTYALGDARKTLLRASYARYANGFGNYPANQLSAIPGVAYAYYPWTDTNGNKIIDPGELNTSGAAIKTVGFNPAFLTAPFSVNSINPNLTSQKTNEYIFGVDHELIPNFAVGAAYTHRTFNNFYFSYRSVAGELPTYVLDHTSTGTLPDGTAYSLPFYKIVGAVPPGSYFTNRPNYTQTYDGAELTFTKRMSSGWMMRGNFAWNNSRQHVGPGACVDPTNTQYSSGEDYIPSGCEDGSILAPNAGGGSGSFNQVNLNSRWSFNMAGAYQLPLAFTIAGNYFGRQGYPIAWYRIDANAAPPTSDGLSRRAYILGINTYRYGWVSQFDLRLDKNIPITSSVSATLAVDCFNVLNTNTVLQRNARLNQSSLATGTNTVQETQNPRVFRLSGRISF
jgi:hypothetical protein